MGLWIKSIDGTQQVELTQEQINALIPVINRHLPSSRLNQACLSALSAAGVPAQFDSTDGSAIAASKASLSQPKEPS